MQDIIERDFGSATDLTELDKEKIRKMYNCLPPQTRPESNSTFITHELRFRCSYFEFQHVENPSYLKLSLQKLLLKFKSLISKRLAFFQIFNQS